MLKLYKEVLKLNYKMKELDPKLEKEIKKYINSALKQGSTKEEIKKLLMQKKYPKEIINKLTEDTQEEKPLFSKLQLAILSLIILIIIIAAALFLPSKGISLSKEINCTDQDCFIQAANNCNSAYLEQDEEGSLFSYKTNNCILTKTAVKLSEDEPIEMIDQFEGSSMTCSYEKANFDTNLLNTLTLGIENCTGQLKDALEDLLLTI